MSTNVPSSAECCILTYADVKPFTRQDNEETLDTREFPCTFDRDLLHYVSK